MPLMTMPRNWTVRTLSGHTIKFEKDAPAAVPNDFRVVEECRRFGAEFIDSKEAVLPDEGASTSRQPRSQAERRAAVMALMSDMRDNQEEHRSHFTAAGRPSTRYVNATLGFDVMAAEVEDLWNQTLGTAEEGG